MSFKELKSMVQPLLDKGSYEKALNKLDEYDYITEFEKTNGLIIKAIICVNTNRIDEAEKNAKSAENLIDKIESELQNIRLQVVYATIRMKEFEFDQAITHCKKIEKIYNNIKGKDSQSPEITKRYTQALNILGIINTYRGQYQNAINYHSKQLNLLKTLNPKLLDLTTPINNIASNKYNLGELKEARSLYRKSLKMVRSTGNYWKISTTLENLAVVTMDMGILNEAEEYLTESLKLKQKLDIPFQTGILQRRIGILYRLKGNMKKAKMSLLESIETLRNDSSINHHEIGQSFEQLALVHMDLNDFDSAKEAYEKSFQEYNKVDRENIGFSIRIQLVKVLISSGNINEAVRELKLISNQMNEEDQILSIIHHASILNNIGVVQWYLGKTRIARDYMEKSLNLFQNSSNKIKESQTLLNLGKIYMSHDNKKRTIEYMKKSYEIWKQIGNPIKLSEIIFHLVIQQFVMDETINQTLIDELKNLKDENKSFEIINTRYKIVKGAYDLSKQQYPNSLENLEYNYLDFETRLIKEKIYILALIEKFQKNTDISLLRNIDDRILDLRSIAEREGAFLFLTDIIILSARLKLALFDIEKVLQILNSYQKVLQNNALDQLADRIIEERQFISDKIQIYGERKISPEKIIDDIKLDELIKKKCGSWGNLPNFL